MPYTHKLILVLGFLLACQTQHSSQASTAPAWTLLKPGIWFVQGEGANVTVASGAEGTLLIDAELESAAPALQKSIRQRGLAQAKWVATVIENRGNGSK